MKRKTTYDTLPLIPYVVAEAVAETPYVGAEWSTRVRDPRQVAIIEAKREKMTRAKIAEFAEAVDRRAREAFDAKADWFMKIVRAKGTSGRDQLYMVVGHWLAAFLTSGRV